VKRTARLALENREALAAALAPLLPARGAVLELGSGTGEHAILFAARFPHLAWQPSDPDPAARASIRAWAAEARLPNLRAPLDLAIGEGGWPACDALLCLNVLHVAPPECGPALVRAAARLLPPGGPLAVFGPFRRRAEPLAGRLARLDAELRATDGRLGVRDADALREAAAAAGLAPAADLALGREGDRLVVWVAGRPTS
jgi:SAM-dependent methyltransferase